MKENPNLILLNDPDHFGTPVHLGNIEPKLAIGILDQMLLIRGVEGLIARLVREGLAKCPCHLATGQEAVPAALSPFLKATDRVFGAHRSHGHYIALGGSVHKLIAEILGKVTGCSKGMGGSMHIVAADKGFMGSVPIVAGTVSLAVGAALAAKMDGKDDIAVAYFGDGACEEGVVHECLNLASIMELPILFVIENNFFSSHMDIHLRQPSSTVSRFAKANCIDNSVVVDGNDAAELLRVGQKVIETMRKTRKPGFIEAYTYRWNGHVGANDDIDVGVNRSLELLNLWKKNDPIRRLELSLVDKEIILEDYVVKEQRRIEDMLDQVYKEACADPYPEKDQVYQYVYHNVGLGDKDVCNGK